MDVKQNFLPDIVASALKLARINSGKDDAVNKMFC